MGKILEYNNLGAPPADDDLLFLGDYSASASNPTTMRLTIADLNKKRNVDAADANGLMLRDDAGNYGIFIKDGGNVGIGNNDASYELDIQNSADTTVRIQSGAANDSIIRFDQSGAQQASIGYDDTGDLLKFNNATDFAGTQHLVINSDGNVGVGVVSPAVSLDVSGDFKIIDGTYGIKIDASNANIEGITNSGTSGPLHLNRSGGENIWFMYGDSTDIAGKIESTNKRWSIGTISSSEAEARLNIKEITSGTTPALKLQTYQASGTVRTVQQFTQTVGAISLHQYLVWDGTQLGIRSTNAAPGTDSVNFSAGKIALGGTAFTRKFNVTDANNIVANFNSSNSSGTRLLIRNTSDASSAVQHSLIAFPNKIGSDEIANWMTGAFKDNANNNYFMIHYSSEIAPTDGQYVFETTTTNNAMRLDTSGNVRFKGTMQASAYYDQGGDALGNYCRGRFIQTFSYRYYYAYNSQRWTPLFSEPVDTTNNYDHNSSTTPDKSMCSKAPMAGRVTRIDVSFTNDANTDGATVFVYSGADAPAADLDISNAAYTNIVNFSPPVAEGDYTLGYNDFVEASRTHLDFAAGDFLMLAINSSSGNANATVVVTVEFNVPDNLGA